MNYESFLTYIQRGLKSYLDRDNNGSVVVIKKVLKNNGIELDALSLMDVESGVSPTVYLNNYYNEYVDGRQISDIIIEIYDLIKKNSSKINLDVEELMDYEKVKCRIAYKLINAGQNKRLLKSVPHVKRLDLAVVFYCIIKCTGRENATMMIHNQHLELWGVDSDEIANQAFANTPVLLPPEIKSMSDIIKEMLTKDDALGESGCYDGEDIEVLAHQLMEEVSASVETPNMFVLTNKYRLNGAAAMLYEGVLKDFANEHDSDLIIIPSSIHEVILIPMEEGMKAHHFNAMIGEVNNEEVDDSEVLSNHAYLYRRSEDDIVYDLP